MARTVAVRQPQVSKRPLFQAYSSGKTPDGKGHTCKACYRSRRKAAKLDAAVTTSPNFLRTLPAES